jgi:ferredoxin--NADP+ reductase
MMTMHDPELIDVQMHLVPPNTPVKATVVKNELCMLGKSASFVRHVCFDVSGTPLEGNFRAGQSFGIVPSGVDTNGKPHKVRLYSIASPTCGEDGAGAVLSTTCKRLIDEVMPQSPSDDEDHRGLFLGVCSNFISDLAPGTDVLVTGPAGKRFVLPKEPAKHDYLFLATGTGIAPFRGMVKDLYEGGSEPFTSEVHLVMGAPYRSDLLYDDFFAGLDSDHPNFHYHRVISREIPSEGAAFNKGYVHHYLDRAIDLHEGLLKNDRTLIYICGLSGMQTGVFQMLAEKGLGDAYLKIKDDLAETKPEEWEAKDIRRYVRPTRRCMLEVY